MMDEIADIFAAGFLLGGTWHLFCAQALTDYADWLLDTFAASGAPD